MDLDRILEMLSGVAKFGERSVNVVRQVPEISSAVIVGAVGAIAIAEASDYSTCVEPGAGVTERSTTTASTNGDANQAAGPTVEQEQEAFGVEAKRAVAELHANGIAVYEWANGAVREVPASQEVE